MERYLEEYGLKILIKNTRQMVAIQLTGNYL